MSGVYAGAAQQTFRKEYNEDEAAKKFFERQQQERKDAMEKKDKKKLGRAYREPSPEDANSIQARRERLNLSENLNKKVLVPAGATFSRNKKGKGAGYYCQECDMTFQDSISWVDHLNSILHLRNTKQTFKQDRATLEDVRKRLDWLRSKKAEAQRAQEYDLDKRLQERARIEAEERNARKEKKRARQQEKKTKVEVESTGDGSGNEEIMAKLMGFGGFGTTKR